jgi:hypothetical protein
MLGTCRNWVSIAFAKDEILLTLRREILGLQGKVKEQNPVAQSSLCSIGNVYMLVILYLMSYNSLNPEQFDLIQLDFCPVARKVLVNLAQRPEMVRTPWKHQPK